MKAIEYCIARFDDETKASFKSLYQKFDATMGINNTWDDFVPTTPDELYEGLTV